MQQVLGSDKQKNILILSYGPVPTPEFQKIEGGGMRCWGLATGLRDNGHSVTVGVFDEFKQTRSVHDGIRLYNWALNEDFETFMNSFDAVIVSYSMGDLSMFVADKLSHHITLILDCYVPIFIEVSARDSDNKAEELRNYLHELRRYNHVLKRGDFFLCANKPQKHMYTGILGSLGILNPYTYRQERLLLVPFGVDSQPIQKKELYNPYAKHTANRDFVLLWFGGLYPWFNFKPLIEAINTLSERPDFKFFLVGGKNPYNNHPDFVKQYEYVIGEFKTLGLINKTVFIVDWIDFDQRINWYAYANAVISINQEGDENEYSWRTRVMDYLWGQLPMLTNGGDPLSDELIEKGGAIKIELSSEKITQSIQKIIEDRSALKKVRKALEEIKSSYHWDKVTLPLSNRICDDNNLPYVSSLAFQQQNNILEADNSHQVIRHVKKLKDYGYKARQKGIKRSTRLALGIVKSKAKHTVKTKIRKDNSPKAILLSHPIDDTGAPLVLIQIAKDFAPHFKPQNIHISSPAIKRHLLNGLLSSGYKIHRMATGLGNRVIQADLNINKDDFVLMNTVGVYSNYRRYAFNLLRTGKLKKLYWFIHEDNPKIRLNDKKEVKLIQQYLASDQLCIIVPSVQTAHDYNDFLKSDKVMPITLRVNIPDKFKQPKKDEDFDIVKFFISGIPLDGRKGQMIFLSALQQFNLKYLDKQPENYREYTLDLVAMGEDYISQQIETLGRSIMGNNLHLHPVMPFEKALEVASDCNVTVCTSLNETFALYVAESMHMGHVILRNHASGWQEQVIDGENGYLFDGDSIDELASRIEKILNKKTSNSSLLKMSQSSQQIAQKFAEADYYQQLLGKDLRTDAEAS